MRGVWLLLLCCACATVTEAPEEAAWREIEGMTRAVYLGNDRVKLTIDKPVFMGAEGVEYALLARAAAEAVARGAPAFAIVHAEYHQRGGFLSDDRPPLGRTHIGTYERLLRHREQETERFGGVTGATFVVKLQEEDEIGLRQSFGSQDTYEAMIAAWADRRGMRAPGGR